ncbi:hypothetical protein [Streptomyces sp. NPDC007172]|uniref:hypothetical protein n=1 Tax=Streptomyces sp. NPDC007172 TaxID=3364776 RepID=UPI0036CA2818
MRRRAALIGVSAAVVLGLGGTLAAGAGGGDRDGYLAVGAAGTGPSAPDRAVPPSGKVRMVPLDGPSPAASPGDGGVGTSSTPSASGTSAGTSGTSGTFSASAPPSVPGAPGTPGTAPGPDGSGSAGSAKSPAGSGGSASGGAPGSPGTPGGAQGGPGGSAGGSSGGATDPSDTPSAPGPPGRPSPPAGPAVLSVGAPSRSAGDHRWCENVTVRFRNTGGTAVKSGSVVFATHIIGLLGVDWATMTSSQPLPAPIAAGAVASRTYGVCVDAWRVPLGMHVETRSVTASWG